MREKEYYPCARCGNSTHEDDQDENSLCPYCHELQGIEEKDWAIQHDSEFGEDQHNGDEAA